MKIRLGTRDADDILLLLQEKGVVRGIRKLMGSPSGCDVTVEAVKPNQTDDQRGLYHASLTDWSKSEWAKEAGVTKGYLHEVCLAKTFGFDLIEVFGLPSFKPLERSAGQDILPYSDLIHTMKDLIIESGADLE